MRSSFRLGSFLLALSIAPLAPLSAQTPASSDAQQMSLHVTVSTHSGDPVPGLTKDDFTLFDNKHQQPITGFQALNDLRTGIIIVLDTVNLPYSQVSFARQQISQFFASNSGHLAQPTTLAILQDKGLQIRPSFTTDGNALRTSLDNFSIGLREVTRSSGIYGADERLEISLKNFELLISQLPKNGAKCIIWISPGWPLLSGPGVELNPSHRVPLFNQVVAINTQLRQSHIIVDAVNPLGAAADIGRTNYYSNFLRAPRSPREIDLGDLGLQVIAVQSGGMVLNGSNDLGALVQRAVAFSKGGYELTFTPAPGEHNDEYHELQLKLRQPGLVAHTNAGYYAKPSFAEPSNAAPAPSQH